MIDLDSGAFTEMPTGVTVLICTYNGAATIAETLACLARQQVSAGLDWEVILVDNASTDGTAERAQEQWDDLGAPVPLRVLREPRPGKQHAVEVGVRAVRYRYACIVDDDNRLESDYLASGYALLSTHPQIGLLGGQNTGTFEDAPPAWFTDFRHCYAVGPQIDYVGGQFKSLADGSIGRNVLWGAGMFVRTEVWQRLRAAGFESLFTGRQGEQNLTAGEDDELCFAALLMGYEVWYAAGLRLRHHMAAGRLTEAYRDRLYYASARSTARLNAYRNALWGNPAGTAAINLLKDTGFIVRSFARNMMTPALASRNGQGIERMMRRHGLMVLRDAVLRFGQVKAQYEQVLRLRERLRALSAPPIRRPA